MDFIKDKALYAAVMFARKMIREGTPPQKANYIAANFYKRNISDVAHYVGQAAAGVKNSKGGKNGTDTARNN
jgi:hypothetical protein